MKEMFLNSSINLIKKNQPNINDIKMEEIRFGLESVYLTFTKLIIFLIISYLLGIIREFFVFLILYNIIRSVAFGLHATKSSICLLSSSIIFLSLPYIAKIVFIPIFIKAILSMFCFIAITLYAPADTYKRPLINKKKRRRYKFLSILITTIYILFIFLSQNVFLSNILLFSLVTEVILILPITYSFFKLPYNNYKNYH